MRIIALLALLLVTAAGCGATETVGGGGTASSTASIEELLPPPTTAVEPSGQRPPPLTLVSAAGSQQAVQGSYCVTGEGMGVCSDSAEIGPPEELSVVRVGETVQLVLKGARTAEGSLSVLRLGCRKVLATIPLTGPATSWAVDLEPGSYELEAFATFETDSTNGDTSGSLGLLVDGTAPLEVAPAPEPDGCPPR